MKISVSPADIVKQVENGFSIEEATETSRIFMDLATNHADFLARIRLSMLLSPTDSLTIIARLWYRGYEAGYEQAMRDMLLTKEEK